MKNTCFGKNLNRFRFFLLSFLLSLYGVVQAQTFSGTYKITARHSGKALDVANSSTADGGNVQQWTANGTPAQQWIVTATTDGHYKLENKGSNKALEVSNNSLADGGNVQQWTYVGSNSQQWKIEATTDGFHRLINRNSGKALDVAGVSTADGANVHQWTYGGGGNQQWKLELVSAPQPTTVTRELWSNVPGNGVAAIPLTTTPTSTSQLSSLEGPTNVADNYGVRIRAYITPATTGSYTFYIASDDNSQLFLGTNDSPTTKTKIAEVTDWTNPREWTKQASQRSTARSLNAGTRYYVEVLHKEATGGDNLAVGWTGPGISTITVIGGSVLSPFAGTDTPPSGIALSVNKNTKHQTIDGFGFFGARDVWWGSANASHFYSDAWLDRIVSDLGVSIWRNELYPHNPPTGNTTPNQDAHWDKQRPMVQALKAKADQYGVDLKMILTVWSPPGEFKWWSQMAWAGDPNALRGPGGDGDYWPERAGGTLNPNKYNQFATWLSQGLQMYKNAGLNVYAISPQNEPMFAQTFNSNTYTSQWYNDMLKAVIPQVKAQHPGVRVYGSEHMLDNEGADNNFPYFYHNKLKSDPAAMSQVDILAVHGYLDGVAASSGSVLADYWTNHKEQFTQPANKKAWMTETSGYVDDWEGANGKPGAFGLANDMHTALYYGDLSAWVYWQGSGLGGINEYNLMSDLVVGKKYYASKNFYRFIRPGAVRLATTSPDASIALTAYEHVANGTHTIVLINNATTAKTINLAMTGSGLPSSFEMFVTSASRNCESVGSVPASSITLPARSVVTLQAGGTPLAGSAPARVASDDAKESQMAGLKGVTIYPNPTNGIVTVSTGDAKAVKATVSTLHGVRLNLRAKQLGAGTLSFDVSGQPAGIYLLQVEADGKRATYRVFKQ